MDAIVSKSLETWVPLSPGLWESGGCDAEKGTNCFDKSALKTNLSTNEHSIGCSSLSFEGGLCYIGNIVWPNTEMVPRVFWKWSKIPKVEGIGPEATLLREKFLLSPLPGIRLTCKCFDDSSMWAWKPLILVGILAFVENSRSRYVVSLKKRTLFYVELTELSIALWIGHCTMYVLCSVLF